MLVKNKRVVSDEERKRKREWEYANRERRRELNRAFELRNKDRRREYRKQWSKKNRSRVLGYRKKYRKLNPKDWKSDRVSFRGRLKAMLGAAHDRAIEKGRVFDLRPHWDSLYPRFSKGVCEASGIPFAMDLGRGRGMRSPSIDRIDSRKGYTIDNVRFVCWGLNRAFGEQGEHEFRPLAVAWLRARGCKVEDPLEGLV